MVLLVLFMRRFIEFLLVGIFCMFSPLGMANCVCSFGVLLFSELFFLCSLTPSFLRLVLSSRRSIQICTLFRVIRDYV